MKIVCLVPFPFVHYNVTSLRRLGWIGSLVSIVTVFFSATIVDRGLFYTTLPVKARQYVKVL